MTISELVKIFGEITVKDAELATSYLEKNTQIDFWDILRIFLGCLNENVLKDASKKGT